MRFLGLILVLFLLSCAQKQLTHFGNSKPDALRVPSANDAVQSMPLGRFAMIQGPTTESQAYFSMISPRYKDYTFILVDSAGNEIARVQPFETVKQENYTFWKIEKFHFSSLSPGTEYGIHVVEKKSDSIKSSIDFRTFKTMDPNAGKLRFVVGSCSADDERFASIRKSIWAKVVAQNPDFIIMNGDVVYVDSFEFVQRESATHKMQEWEIWGRYMDSFRTLEIFRSKKLFPIMANWDDHDMGTNNSDVTFSGRDYARRIFKALFHAPDIRGTFAQFSEGVSTVYTINGQKFMIMDGRYYRQPSGTQKDPYGHFGQKLHDWVIAESKANPMPTWLVMGDQFFMTLVTANDKGKEKVLNESFIGDHPVHFEKFLSEMKSVAAPVLFVSGDVHFSEISSVDPKYLGYQTYEVTASPFHSYIFGGKTWANPNRIIEFKEHNFLVIDSEAQKDKIKAHIRSIGAESDNLFEKDIVVAK